MFGKVKREDIIIEHFEYDEIAVSYNLSYEKKAKVGKNQVAFLEYSKYDSKKKTTSVEVLPLTEKENDLRVEGRRISKNKKDRVVYVNTAKIDGIAFNMTIPMQLERVYDFSDNKTITNPCEISVKGFYDVKVDDAKAFLNRSFFHGAELTKAKFEQGMESRVSAAIRKALVELTENREEKILAMVSGADLSSLSKKSGEYVKNRFEASNFILCNFEIMDISIPEKLKDEMKKHAKEVSDSLVEKQKKDILAWSGSPAYIEKMSDEEATALRRKADILGTTVEFLINAEIRMTYARNGITTSTTNMNTAAA